MFSKQVRGFYKGQIVKNLIGILILIIISVAVILPTVENLTSSYIGSGITATAISYFSTFIAIGLILVIFGVF